MDQHSPIAVIRRRNSSAATRGGRSVRHAWSLQFVFPRLDVSSLKLAADAAPHMGRLPGLRSQRLARILRATLSPLAQGGVVIGRAPHHANSPDRRDQLLADFVAKSPIAHAVDTSHFHDGEPAEFADLDAAL